MGGDQWIQFDPFDSWPTAQSRPPARNPAIRRSRRPGTTWDKITATPIIRPWASARPRAFWCEKGFVDVLGQEMETALLILIQTVVAAANPIPIVVDECIFEGEKLQGAINVQQRLQHLFQLVGGRFVQHVAKLDEG